MTLLTVGKKRNKQKAIMGRRGSMLLVGLLTCLLLCGCRSLRDKEAELSYRQKGISSMAVGRYEEAAGYFQKALDQSMGGIGDLEIDICLYKAEALYLQGQIDEAETLYTALIDYDDMPQARYLRGNLLFSKGDREAGCEDFAAAAEKDHSNYALFIGIYETLSKYGMTEEGEAYLQKALEIKGSNAEAMMQRGRIYYLLGDYEAAMEALDQAITQGSKEANFYMAQVYSVIGDFDGSDRYFDAYMVSGAANAHNLMVLGENRMNAGDYQAALKYLKGATELGTIMEADRQQLMRDTIIAYEYNRNFDAAYELVQEYAKAYPNDFDADKELTFLKTRSKSGQQEVEIESTEEAEETEETEDTESTEGTQP